MLETMVLTKATFDKAQQEVIEEIMADPQVAKEPMAMMMLSLVGMLAMRKLEEKLFRAEEK